MNGFLEKPCTRRDASASLDGMEWKGREMGGLDRSGGKRGMARGSGVYILITPSTDASLFGLVGQREAIHRYPHLASALFIEIVFCLFYFSYFFG
jgi:hypothetical protein